MTNAIPKTGAQPPLAVAVITTPPPSPPIIDRIKQIYANAVAKVNSAINACLEKVQSLVGRVKYTADNLLSSLSFELTETKVKQIIAIAFSSYFVLGAKVVAGGIPSTFFQWAVASPLLAVSAGALSYALTLVDYENPEKLEKIRKASQKLPLNDLLYLHGWQNIFRYGILTPDEFRKAFCQLANSLSFKELYALHTKAKNELAVVNSSSSGCQHKIPVLAEWKEKFTQDTVNLTQEQILSIYPDLLDLNLIASDRMALFIEVQSLLESKKREEGDFDNKISEFLEDAKRASLKTIQNAQNTLSEIERVKEHAQEGSEIKKERFPFLGEKYDEFRRQANEGHKQKMGKILDRLNEIGQRNNSSPNKA